MTHFSDRAAGLWSLPRLAPGRHRLRAAVSWLAWPVLGPAAAVYRRTALRRTPVIVIVGSFGKGATKRAIAAALGVRAPSGANYWSAVAAAVLRHQPPAPLVIEVGISRPGQMQKYARVLRPDFAVVTAVGGAHRRGLRTLERTQHEKGWMVAGLRAGGVAVLNGDDQRVSAMAERLPARARGVVRFGFGPHNDLRGEERALDWPAGARLRVRGRGVDHAIKVRLIGDHTLRAARAAGRILFLGHRSKFQRFAVGARRGGLDARRSASTPACTSSPRPWLRSWDPETWS